MADEDKSFSDFSVLDLRIWWRHMHPLYYLVSLNLFTHERLS